MSGLAIGLADLRFIGRSPALPECVVTTMSGEAFVSDRCGRH
jgi:hypothetical protein